MTMTVEVVRPTVIRGRRCEPGDHVELPRAQALDALAGGRVMRVEIAAEAAEPHNEPARPRRGRQAKVEE